MCGGGVRSRVWLGEGLTILYEYCMCGGGVRGGGVRGGRFSAERRYYMNSIMNLWQ